MASSRKIDNILLWAIKGMMFLIPFLPLYVSTSLVFPYITGKNFAFRILVECAAALWLVLISINQEYRLRNSPVTLSILIFTFVVGLADLFGVSPYNSFWSNYERMEGYITILHLAVYFMILRCVFRDRRDWILFFNLIITVSALVSVFALSKSSLSKATGQFALEYGDRIWGTIGNPPFLASYLLLSVFFGLILIINTQRLYLKCMYSGLIIINSIAIYLSASRGAILGAFMGAVMFGLLYIAGRTDVYGKKLVTRSLLSIIGVLIILSVIFVTFRNAEFVRHDKTLSRFATMLSDASAHTRFSAWKLAWEGFKEKPVLGWGQENFIGVYTVNSIPFVDEQIWVDRAHNIVIDWLINAGLLGLFSYLAIFVITFYAVRRAFQKKTVSKKEALTIVTVLAAYFIHNLFTFDTINTYVLFFTLLAYADNLNDTKGVTETEQCTRFGTVKITPLYVALPALLVFSFMCYYVNFKPVKESLVYTRIKKASSKKYSYADLLNDYNKALSLETFGDTIVRRGMLSMSSFIISTHLFNQKVALQVVEATVRELEKGIQSNRYNLQYLTDTINFYKLVAEYEPSMILKTEALIRECMRLNPEYQWLYMALADVCVLKKDYEGAFANVKKITDWDPQNDEKQFKLALAAILASREEVLSQALENVKRIRMANNTAAYGQESVFSVYELRQIAQVYKEAGKIKKALHYYKKMISLLPAAYRYDIVLKTRSERAAMIHFEAAMIYLEVGDKENAIREASKAAEMNPENFAEKAEEIIYSLNK